MEEMEFRNLKRVVLNEARKLDAAYADKEEFSEADAKKYDCLMHGLKCQLTAEAMLAAEGYEGEGGMSGRRGRSPVTGRYVSMDGGQSYAEGYSHGYNEAMALHHGGQSYSDGYDKGYADAMKHIR